MDGYFLRPLHRAWGLPCFSQPGFEGGLVEEADIVAANVGDFLSVIRPTPQKKNFGSKAEGDMFGDMEFDRGNLEHTHSKSGM